MSGLLYTQLPLHIKQTNLTIVIFATDDRYAYIHKNKQNQQSKLAEIAYPSGAPELTPVFSVTRSIYLGVMFCRSLFDVLSFLF